MMLSYPATQPEQPLIVDPAIQRLVKPLWPQTWIPIAQSDDPDGYKPGPHAPKRVIQGYLWQKGLALFSSQFGEHFPPCGEPDNGHPTFYPWKEGHRFSTKEEEHHILDWYRYWGLYTYQRAFMARLEAHLGLSNRVIWRILKSLLRRSVDPDHVFPMQFVFEFDPEEWMLDHRKAGCRHQHAVRRFIADVVNAHILEEVKPESRQGIMMLRWNPNWTAWSFPPGDWSASLQRIKSWRSGELHEYISILEYGLSVRHEGAPKGFDDVWEWQFNLNRMTERNQRNLREWRERQEARSQFDPQEEPLGHACLK